MYSVTFQTHYFWPKNANNIEMNICLNMCSLMGKTFAVFLELQRVLVKNAKNDFFRTKVFSR